MKPQHGAKAPPAPPAAATLSEAMAEGNRLAAAKDFVGAIERFTYANRRARSPKLEKRLRTLREKAFNERPRGEARPGRGDPRRAAPVDPSLRLPAVSPDRLDANVLADTIAAHGVLVCSGLLSPGHVETLRDGIDRAFEARHAIESGTLEESAWFDKIARISPMGRYFQGPTGMYICDSPRGLYHVLEVFGEAGILDLLHDRLGREVTLMPDKCVMRRMEPMSDEQWTVYSTHMSRGDVVATWHQDAPFLDAVDAGPSVVDVWCCLSPCGEDAPGLGVVPANLERLLPTFADEKVRGVVSASTLAEELPGVDAVAPPLSPGDVVFIDQFTVHGTSFRRHMSQMRYSVEGWFFSADAFPTSRAGLIV